MIRRYFRTKKFCNKALELSQVKEDYNGAGRGI
ncbi:uncharacterized protein METZ01_LOCUS275086 [marine metagenome]|uniref:Uncharacterized protein n=1 Tax=marine metagenome TaxID=408172 RepID=A0A382KFV4_9ZZZZ